MFGCKSPDPSIINKQNLQNLSPSITLDQFESQFGKGKRGHGPYICQNPKYELLVFVKPLAGYDKHSDEFIDNYDPEIVGVFMMEADNENVVEVIWPKEYTKMSGKEAMIFMYSKYQKK